MSKSNLLKVISLIVISCFTVQSVIGQITINGTVYDITKKTPIQSVSVLSTGGKGTETDSAGHYSITVREIDSIYFSYLNKPTPKYPVSSIATLSSFDIAIQKKIVELPSIFIRQRNYRFDSLENRKDYARIFNYSKPGVRTSIDPTPGGIGAGLDLDELINMFKFRKNRHTAAFQQRLLREEQDKYIDHRYTKGLVRKLTGLTSPEIENFMKEYRPTYEMTVKLNDLEFGQFIQETYKYYKNYKSSTSK